MLAHAVALSIAASLILAPQGTKKPEPAVQMPGDNGKVGVPYMMGAKNEELVFTLEKAEFASRTFLSDDVVFAEPTERLLTLTFAVQNPGKSDTQFNGAAFKFTVVSPDDKNYEYAGYFYHPEKLDVVEMRIKPAQKVRCFVSIRIHQKGVVNKLIVQRPQAPKVLRYDLRSSVKPMTGTFAADGGIDSLETGRAKVGTPFDVGYFDVTIEKVEESATATGGFTPDDGKKLIIITTSIKNVSKCKPGLDGPTLAPKLLDENGDEARYETTAKMTSEEPLGARSMDPDQQVRYRYVLHLATAAKPVSLMLTDAHSHRTVKVALK